MLGGLELIFVNYFPMIVLEFFVMKICEIRNTVSHLETKVTYVIFFPVFLRYYMDYSAA